MALKQTGPRQITPRTGDTISGHGKVTNVDDYGHDTSMRYTMDTGEQIYASHRDFTRCDKGCWHYSRHRFSGWAGD